MEKWKTIDISPSYEVSNFGRVRNTNFNNLGLVKEMSYYVSHRGYKMVGIVVDGKQRGKSVHRLVAQAFIPNPENKPMVNHIDGDKLNNDVNNLEWCTNRENQMHSFYKMKNYGLTKPILCVETNVVYESAQQAARATGIWSSSISAAGIGKLKTAGGYHWKRLA